ncbi:MAG: ribonuclease III [Clostridia bacterium]|nr:ribonuclease III [Clostridia bacterium]
MSRLTLNECDPKKINTLALAFVGDGVYDLMVREELVCRANRPVRELNIRKVDIVRCQAQAALVKEIEPLLTEEEADILRRGRNDHVAKAPKNATMAEYHAATALECLIGYLYLSDRIERIRELVRLGIHDS